MDYNNSQMLKQKHNFIYTELTLNIHFDPLKNFIHFLKFLSDESRTFGPGTTNPHKLFVVLTDYVSVGQESECIN